MDIPLGAEVFCTDGHAGRSEYLLIEPNERVVTHVVVKGDGFAHAERLVPLRLVEHTEENALFLSCTRKAFHDLEFFLDVQVIPCLERLFFGTPLGNERCADYAFDDSVLVERELVPPGERVLRRGEAVDASDEPVGVVTEAVVEPGGHLSHLVMRRNRLAQNTIFVPVSSIAAIEDTCVKLTLNRHSAQQLISFPALRRSVRRQKPPRHAA